MNVELSQSVHTFRHRVETYTTYTLFCGYGLNESTNEPNCCEPKTLKSRETKRKRRLNSSVFCVDPKVVNLFISTFYQRIT